MSNMTKYSILAALCVSFITLVFVFNYFDDKPKAARIEKIATVKLDDGAIEVIAIKHRGNQCYLLIGQSTTRLINMKADIVCP